MKFGPCRDVSRYETWLDFFCVEWMRLVTTCSFFENASLTLMSATLPPVACLGSRTALMLAPALVTLQ